MIGTQVLADHMSQLQQALGQQQMNVNYGLRTLSYYQEDKIKNKKEERGTMKMMKEYLEKHKDAIFTVALVMLVDHFIFGGAFREKIKITIEALLEKAQKQLAKHEH